MNPMQILQLKALLTKFKTNHPKIPLFFNAVSKKIDIDTIIEIKVTSPDGKNIISNFKVTNDDLELLNELKKQIQN